MLTLTRVSAVLCLMVSLFISAAHAENLPFMNQSKIRITASAGERVFAEMTLTNPTDKAKDIRLYLEDWYYLPGGSGAKEFLPAGSSADSACPWITFSPAEVTIPAYGKQKISYSVAVPKDASGTKYASLFFETLVSESPSSDVGRSAGLNISVRVATLFYIEVKGATERSAKISNLKIEPANKNKKSLDITLDFENTGNMDITTSANYSLISKDGIVGARGAFNDLYTFPGGKGTFLGTWSNNIPAGDYDLVVTVDLGKALMDAGTGRGPVITEEAPVTIGENNQIVQVGQFK